MKSLNEELQSGFIGHSPRILQIRAQLEKLATRRSPVLIQGESGTGKEVAARTLFNAHPRGHFVPVDCASLVGTMMESELFGHVRGAFTGAVDAKKSRDLEREVVAGRFREDLFHRLNVVRLTLPPLRERKEDIPALIERFLADAPGRYSLSHGALEAMLDYNWPGNIRELKNALERMMALNSGPLLHFADLPTGIANDARARGATGFAAAAAAGGRGAVIGPLHNQPAAQIIVQNEVVPLVELERRAIAHALEHTRGDRTTAAQLLGIGRTTLYRKLKEYRLE